MAEQIFTVPENAQINIRAHSDLNLVGWEKSEVHANGDSRRAVSVQNNGNIYTITCSDDCDLTVPANSRLVVERVGGDAHMNNLVGGLLVQKVGGDLSIQQAGPLEILSIGGDCLIYDIRGSLNIQRVGGDLTGGKFEGPISISSAGGDVVLRLAGIELTLNGRGDVSLGLDEVAGQKINVNASGDAGIFLPTGTNADLSLVCGGDIGIKTANLNQDADHIFNGRLGEGGARLIIHAGGDINISDKPWDGSEVMDAVADLQEYWADLAERRARRLEQEAQRSAADRTFMVHVPGFNLADLDDRVNQKVARKMRKAQARIDAAMQRAEERSQRGFRYFVPPVPPIPPVPPVPPVPPYPTAHPVDRAMPVPQPPAAPENSGVSEDERLMILKMLQAKKITPEEAEKLLEALEG